MQKFTFVYLLIIWYFTAKNWWKNVILIPLSVLLFQTIMVLDDDVKFKDEGSLDTIIVTLTVVFFCTIIYYTRKKISFYIDAIDLKEKMDLKIREIEQEVND